VTRAVLSRCTGLSVSPLPAVVPPLVTLLPGAMLALAMKELAYGDMVSGSSRLITGFVQVAVGLPARSTPPDGGAAGIRLPCTSGQGVLLHCVQ
jgi:hypothetical protein